MPTHRTIRYRLLCGGVEKGQRLERIASQNRWLYNQLLAKAQETYQYRNCNIYGLETGDCESPTMFTFCKWITKLRSQHKWLNDGGLVLQRSSAYRLGEAYKKFFKEGGYPKFKSRQQDPSFDVLEKFRIEGCGLTLPKTPGTYTLKGSNPYPDGVAKKITIKKESGKWYAYVCYAIPECSKITSHHIVGLDRNVGQVADSEGNIHRLPDTKALESRKRRYQRMMARQQKGSNRREITKQRIAKVSRKIMRQRDNWCHQLSSSITTKFHNVVMEKLNTKGMTKKAKETRVAAKSGLNRSILNSGWGKLADTLSYKANKFIEVDATYTSQTCSKCSHIDSKNRVSQSHFECVKCGYTLNADINAAYNIKARGIFATAHGGGGVTWPVKCENGIERLRVPIKGLAKLSIQFP